MGAMRRGCLTPALLAVGLTALRCATTGARPFAIHVVDADTGRGVPLVELSTVNGIRHYTDSNGIVAFDEPGLLGGRVFFNVSSHGYQYGPQGKGGVRGLTLATAPGGRAEIMIKRLNVAERLYRITGAGIYADSVRVGAPVPLRQPVLAGEVMGQDSALAIQYRGKIHWFWGDTSRVAGPLGQFATSGATSV